MIGSLFENAVDLIRLKTPLSKSTSALPALVDRLTVNPSSNEDLSAGGMDGDSQLITVISRYMESTSNGSTGSGVGGGSQVCQACYALFLKGQGHQGISYLVKGTLMRKLLISTGAFPVHQGNDQGVWRQSPLFPP